MQSNLINKHTIFAVNTVLRAENYGGCLLSLQIAINNHFLGHSSKKRATDIMVINPTRPAADAKDLRYMHEWSIPRPGNLWEELFFHIICDWETIQAMSLSIVVGGQTTFSISGRHLNVLGMINQTENSFVVRIPLSIEIPPAFHQCRIYCEINQSANICLKMRYALVDLVTSDILIKKITQNVPVTLYNELLNVDIAYNVIQSFRIPRMAYKVILKLDDVDTCPPVIHFVNDYGKILFKQSGPNTFSVILNPVVDAFFNATQTHNNFHNIQYLMSYCDSFSNPTLEDLMENLRVREFIFQQFQVPLSVLLGSFRKSTTNYITFENGQKFNKASLFISSFNILQQREGLVGLSYS